MVLKVTQNMINSKVINNINTIRNTMLTLQNQLSSGKRVNKPSDDPVNATQILTLQNRVTQDTQFLRNVDYAKGWLQQSEGALSSVNRLVTRAKELALQQSNSVSYNAANRTQVAAEIGQMINELIGIGNESIGSRYVFGGTITDPAPVGSGGVFYGSSQGYTTQVDETSTFNYGVSASRVFANDFNPNISLTTPVSSLFKGAGAGTLGLVSVTNRAGTTGTVDLTGAATVGDIINRFNASGLNITAAINASGNGISLTDATASPTGNLIISDGGDGLSTATKLRISGNRAGSTISGGDIDPAATGTTLISELNGGAGLTLNQIHIQNGAASGIVTLSGSATLQDVINTVNASGLNVTATINASGTGIDINSNSSSTVAIVSDVANDNTASSLGMQGGKNLIMTFTTLQKALLANDRAGILNSITNLDASLNTVNQVRAEIGGKVNRLESRTSILENNGVENEISLTYLRDTDMTQASMDFFKQKAAQDAALSTAAKIMNTTLMDFLR